MRLGTINPIEDIIEKAHQFGAAVLVDGAQACPHLKPDVQALDVDFYVASLIKCVVQQEKECFTAKKNGSINYLLTKVVAK